MYVQCCGVSVSGSGGSPREGGRPAMAVEAFAYLKYKRSRHIIMMTIIITVDKLVYVA